MSLKEERTKKVLPEPHPVELRDLRNVIPKHCFERSYVTSFRYAIQDIIGVAICIYIGQYIDNIPYDTIRWSSWILLWIIQGAFMTGLWVVAHECGHQAFSPNIYVNDTVGCILHSMLLVPYWSWKYSHGQHHANTDSLSRDTVFVPYTSKDVDKNIYNNNNDTNVNRGNPLYRLFCIIRMSLIGWWVYLLLDISGPPDHKNNGWVSHFNPYCTLFKKSQRKGVIASNIALIIWIYILYQLTLYTNIYFMIKFYWIPYLIVNHWLVTITFLQHTDEVVPRYKPQAWSWLRGALGTVDRDYGIFNIFHHRIADTHVLHHIFSKIPHYHALEATKAMIDSHLIDEYYLYDNTPWYIALWNSYRDCWFVADHDDVAFFEGNLQFAKKID